jgi:minor extracellular protease Epr
LKKGFILILIFLLTLNFIPNSGIEVQAMNEKSNNAQKDKIIQKENSQVKSPSNSSFESARSNLENKPSQKEMKTEVNKTERVIVLFKNQVDKNIVQQAKGKINREYQNLPALAISIPSIAIKGLENNPNVLVVEQDQIIEVKQTLDWGIERTEAPASWDASFTGKGINIAVVDTGIATHDDLVISGGASFTSYTSSFADDNGHGTHVAGIIGARNNSIGTVGIAHESNIYAVKVLDKNGSGYLSDVVAGIDWSISNQMDIVNLSLGTTSHSSTLKQIVDKAYNQGVLVVAAGGNNGTSDGSGDTVNYPARYDSVIAVSAIDSKDQRASFSATGSTIEVAAPGVSVLSTYLGNKYVRMSGTSMSTPYVAGNMALLKQAYKELSHGELRAKLHENVIDLGEAGKDNWFGYGLIQAPKHKTSDPVEEVKQVLKMLTNVSTNKSSYVIGDNINITVQVSDEHGKALPGAEVALTITPPKGKLLTGKGTSNQYGIVTFVMSTKRNTETGTYHIKTNTLLINYEDSTATTSFVIR